MNLCASLPSKDTHPPKEPIPYTGAKPLLLGEYQKPGARKQVRNTEQQSNGEKLTPLPHADRLPPYEIGGIEGGAQSLILESSWKSFRCEVIYRIVFSFADGSHYNHCASIDNLIYQAVVGSFEHG
jgi:hypothetical protein